MHVLRELVVVEALRRLDRIAEDLQLGIGKGRQKNNPSGSTPSPAARAWYFFRNSMMPGNSIAGTGSHNSTLTMPFICGPSWVLSAAVGKPTKAPPSMLVLSPISVTVCRMPTVSGGYEAT